MALAHRTAGLSAAESSLIFDHHGLGSHLSAKEFYNLSHSEGRRSNQEALDLLLTCLEFEDFRVRCFFKYLLDDQGRRTARVLEHLFFCSSEQIRLGRRFLSGFLMQTDATFNTNSLHLPLSVMVGITNTGRTFPLAFAFLKSESAEAFEFVNAQLAELIWYDCPPPRVVLGDQSKGLTAAMALSQARADQGSQRGDQQILQLCEWHAAESIKKRLLDSGRYTKERREDLLRLIWEYIQAPDEEQLGKGRHKLLAEMREPERLYVENNWKEKEKQFARAHTRHYPNLGCNTTQRNESYHVVVKASLNRQLPLQVACQKLAHSLKKLNQKITDDGNRSRIDVPRLLDRPAFRHLIGKVPHYVVGKLAPEWEAAKALRWMRGTELQKERLASPVDTGCTKSSSNLGLSHSASFTRAGSSTVLQWFVTGPCRMEMQRLQAQTCQETGLEVVQAQAALSGQQAEEFSRLFRLQNERLIANFQRHAQSRNLLPPELPSALQIPELEEFKSHGSSRLHQPILTTPPVLADARQPVDGTKRSRKPTVKVTEMAAMAAENGVKRPFKNTENEDPEPRRKRRKVLKQDETQLELQQEPTQDCIAVGSIID
ncbi:hypothetical protein HIM_10711 [Hirsutella minnesotensis 3608]|uniref:MULE transposase domain-containing protein n=1 Tax=Hirsutella minnesotensis 3608 TaxID=1043627 RepID=A0A0F7ZJS1_9HYPO|nr:hypothetical protein HIM_10711 [Hirsutella minnesotensis 3608]